MKPWGQKHSVFFLWSCNHFVEKCPLALTSSVLGRVAEERWCTHSVSPISCQQGWRRNLVAPSYPVQKSSWYFSKILQGEKVTENNKLMSLWQVDICWLVASLRLSILYLHPLPSFALRASQFRAISPFCIQGGPVVCQNNGDPDQNYSRQRICEWWCLCFVTSFLSPVETVESNDAGCSVGKQLIPGQWRVFSNCDIDIRNVIIADTKGKRSVLLSCNTTKQKKYYI